MTRRERLRELLAQRDRLNQRIALEEAGLLPLLEEGSIYVADVAERLRVSQQAANKRLNAAWRVGVLDRQAEGIDGGGRMYSYSLCDEQDPSFYRKQR